MVPGSGCFRTYLSVSYMEKNDLNPLHVRGALPIILLRWGENMATVSECDIPEDRYYWVDKHVWARQLASGEVEVGITDPAQALAGKMLVCRIKRVGRELKRGASAATLESGKWVGGVPTPVAGTLSAINTDAEQDPERLNRDPYGTWLFKIQSSNVQDDLNLLSLGSQAVALYQQKLLAEGIQCHHS